MEAVNNVPTGAKFAFLDQVKKLTDWQVDLTMDPVLTGGTYSNAATQMIISSRWIF